MNNDNLRTALQNMLEQKLKGDNFFQLCPLSSSTPLASINKSPIVALSDCSFQLTMFLIPIFCHCYEKDYNTPIGVIGDTIERALQTCWLAINIIFLLLQVTKCCCVKIRKRIVNEQKNSILKINQF